MPKADELRVIDDIQQAHDLLVSILFLDDPKIDEFFTKEVLHNIQLSIDVLCWVLNHANNDNFAVNLADLKQYMLVAGYALAQITERDEIPN